MTSKSNILRHGWKFEHSNGAVKTLKLSVMLPKNFIWYSPHGTSRRCVHSSKPYEKSPFISLVIAMCLCFAGPRFGVQSWEKYSRYTTDVHSTWCVPHPRTQVSANVAGVNVKVTRRGSNVFGSNVFGSSRRAGALRRRENFDRRTSLHSHSCCSRQGARTSFVVGCHSDSTSSIHRTMRAHSRHYSGRSS